MDKFKLEYKVDVLDELKKAGYNTNKIRKEKIFAESTLTRLREEKPVSLEVAFKLSHLTHLDLTELFQYVLVDEIAEDEEDIAI